MKNALTLLSIVLSLAAISFVFFQNKEIDRLSKQLEIATINTAFQTIIKPTIKTRSFDFTCIIRVEESYGKFAKWYIEVNGLQHQINGSVVTLTHNDSFGISQSWFPKRENGGGAGNSVSSDEQSYSFELKSKYHSGKAVSLFSRLMNVCAE